MNKLLPWIKSNLISVVALLLAVVALPVAWFVSTGMAEADLEQAQSDINSVERDLNGVSRTYTIPSLDPNANDFTINSPPHPNLTAQVREQTALAAEQAQRIRQLVIQQNAGEKERLIPELFPEPAGESGPNGRIALTNQMLDRWPEAHRELLQSVNAGSPPDPEDVRRELTAQRDRLQEQFRRASAEGTLAPEDRERIREQLRDLRLERYREAASKLTFYATPDAFATMQNNPHPPGTRGPAIDEYQEQFWRWQHTYWVESDIVKGLAAANGSRSVLTGPVKRLVSLEVAPLDLTGQTGAGSDDYSASFTGRAGDDFYTVRYANLQLIADVGRLTEIVNGLAEQNFITVINWDYQLLAPSAGITRGYDYGDAQIASVNLTLETLWIRDWYDQWIPPTVRELMGLPPLETATNDDASNANDA